MPRTASTAQRDQRVALHNPGPAVPNGLGGFTHVWTALDPPVVDVQLAPATARDLERVAVGTVLSTASHIATMNYHAGVTLKTRLTKGPRNADGSLVAGSRQFSVTGRVNPGERNVELVLVCVEVLS
jgi:hypothetical protein